MGVWTGTVPTILGGDVPTGDDWDSILDELTAISSAWTDYSSSVTWAGSGGNPSLGNGTLVARYRQVGKQVYYVVSVTMGSTTTYGSGFWTFTIPVTLRASNIEAGAAIFQDAGVGQKDGGCWVSGTTLFGAASTGILGPTTPQTWATGDVLQLSIEYEAA